MDEIFAFKLLKLLDELQGYSKQAVIEEYDSYDDEIPEIILKKSVYPTGEKLGFYNYSNLDFKKLEKTNKGDIKNEFLDYIDSFSENALDVLDMLNIEELICEMSDDELLELICKLNIFDGDDFLISIIANCLYQNQDDFCVSSLVNDNLFALSTSIKIKQINPKANIGFSGNINSKILDLFNINDFKGHSNLNIANLAFDVDAQKFNHLISGFDSGILAITISSSFFDENSELLSNIKNPNYLKALISLPIYDKGDNLMLIILDSDKDSSQFLFIEESDSLIHKQDEFDYSFVFEELLPNINESYVEFKEYDNALILPVSTFVTKKSKFSGMISDGSVDESPTKKRVYKSEVDDLIALNEQKSAFIQKQMQRSNVHGVHDDSTEMVSNYPSRLEELMYAKKRQPLENLLYKNDKKLLDEDVMFVNLADVADLRSINQKNDKDTILIATCKDCNSKIVYYNHDVENIDYEEAYIEIDNISPDILKQYLYVYLNSLNGLDEIRYFSKKNFMITPEQLGYVKIPILKVTTQLELVDAVRESEEFFKSIDLLKKDFQSNILDYKHVIDSINELRGNIEFERGDVVLSHSMSHAYSRLIWPLAISYLYATKGSLESVEKKDNYLVLFEFVAAFNFVILLSGLPDNVYQSYKWKIWNHRNKSFYKDMTFGKWVVLSENIAKVYRKNNFTSKLDEGFFNRISSKKILKILNIALEYRNNDSHGAYTNKYEAEKVIDELNVYLEDIFEILQVYSNYKLIYVVDSNDLNHTVIHLNGPFAQPIYETFTFNEKLKNNRLYLYNPRNNKKLLIKDNFMKFAPVDDDKKHWALFIYDECDKDDYYAFYKCYQSNEEPLKSSIYDFVDDILG